MTIALPGSRQPIAQANGLPDTVWFRFFESMANASNGMAAQAGVAAVNDATTDSATDVPILSQAFGGNALGAGASFEARVSGLTTNTGAGTLTLWLAVNGVKVFTQSFTTPDIPGADKGFTANFGWTIRTQGSTGTMQAAGDLILALNYPTVLPSANTAKSAIDTTKTVTFTVGFSWDGAGNTATAKVATIKRVA